MLAHYSGRKYSGGNLRKLIVHGYCIIKLALHRHLTMLIDNNSTYRERTENETTRYGVTFKGTPVLSETKQIRFQYRLERSLAIRESRWSDLWSRWRWRLSPKILNVFRNEIASANCVISAGRRRPRARGFPGIEISLYMQGDDLSGRRVVGRCRDAGGRRAVVDMPPTRRGQGHEWMERDRCKRVSEHCSTTRYLVRVKFRVACYMTGNDLGNAQCTVQQCTNIWCEDILAPSYMFVVLLITAILGGGATVATT